jgi:chemotaxis protein methyltransferase CheR
MDSKLEDIEIELLLEAIYRYYHVDFRNYSRVSVKRRIWHMIHLEGLPNISALQEKILHNRDYMERFLHNLSITVTSMFRDPSFYLALRNKVIPTLRTYPFIRIWHAGCSTGEEVYSMAILLQEEGIYHRCRLYATDINERVLQHGKAGIFTLTNMQEYTQNYLQAGGKKSLSEYYTAGYDSVVFDTSLKKNMIFSLHNLVSDRSFNDFNIIVCRNVLIYFNKTLQANVHKLFYQSLTKFGILALGRQETIRFSPHELDYEILDNDEKIYRRIGEPVG